MDSTRLANVIFNRGLKIQQNRYQAICESIENDQFTLDEYVMDYKMKENFMGKVPYMLDDGTKVLVSESVLGKINGLSMDTSEVESFMKKNYSNFKRIVEVISNGSN